MKNWFRPVENPSSKIPWRFLPTPRLSLCLNRRDSKNSIRILFDATKRNSVVITLPFLIAVIKDSKEFKIPLFVELNNHAAKSLHSTPLLVTMSGQRVRATDQAQGSNLIDSFQDTDKRASWDDFNKEHLVKLLCSYGCPQKKNNRWSKKIWVDITNKMRAKFPECSFSTDQLKQLERDIKKKHKLMMDASRKHGLRFDKEKFMLVTSDAEWQRLFKIEPKIKKWHRKLFPYYAELDVLYGDQGAASENHQATDGNANHSTSANGDVGQTFRSPTSLRNPEEEIYGGLSPFCSLSDQFEPDQLLDGNEHSQNLGGNNTNPSVEASLAINLVQNQRLTPTKSQHRASSSHASTNLVAANSYLTYRQCLIEYDTLPGFDGCDAFHASKIFDDFQNRTLFSFFSRANKTVWLRQMIDARKKQG